MANTKPKADDEPTAIELERAEQAKVEDAIGHVVHVPASFEQDPQQARVDAAIAALHAGDENPQAAADKVEAAQAKAAKP